jgi:hypothetical protein
MYTDPKGVPDLRMLVSQCFHDVVCSAKAAPLLRFSHGVDILASTCQKLAELPSLKHGWSSRLIILTFHRVGSVRSGTNLPTCSFMAQGLRKGNITRRLKHSHF